MEVHHCGRFEKKRGLLGSAQTLCSLLGTEPDHREHTSRARLTTSYPAGTQLMVGKHGVLAASVTRTAANCTFYCVLPPTASLDEK